MALGSLLVKIGADTSEFERGMQRFSTEIGKAVSFAGKLSSGFERLGNKLTDIGTRLSLGITAPLTAFASVSVKAAGDIDALRRALLAVSSSAGEAALMFERLKKVAELPGLGFKEAVQGAVNLRAVGFSAERTIEILQQLGNALASVGRGRADLEEAIRQLGQLASRGKVTADNLRPLLERIPQLATIMKREFGTIDTEILQKMGVSAEKFIQVMLKGLSELPRVTGGIKNDIENFRDSLNRAIAQAGESLVPFASAALRALQPVLDGLTGLAQAFSRLPDNVQLAVVSITAALAAVGPLTVGVGQLIKTFAQLEAFILRLGPALMALATTGLGSLASAVSNVAVAIATGTTGALVGLELKVLAVAKAASLAAAAFVGWKLGEWIDRNIVSQIPALDRFFQRIADVPGALIAKLNGTTNQAKAANEEFIQSVALLEAKLKAKGIVIERGNSSLEEYALKLRRAAAATQSTSTATQALTKAVSQSSEAQEAMRRWLEMVRRSFEEAAEAARGIRGVMRSIAEDESLKQLEQQWFQILENSKRLREEGLDVIIMSWQGAAEAALPDLNRVNVAITDIGKGLSILEESSTQVFDASLDGLRRFSTELPKLPAGLEASMNQTFEAISTQSKKIFKEQDQAWKTFHRQVSTIVNDLGKGLADVILKGGELQKVFVGALREIGNAVMRLVTEQLAGMLVKVIKDLINGHIPNLIKAFKDLTQTITGFAKAASGAVAGGTAGGAAAGAAGGAAPGSVPTPEGGLIPTLNMITGVVSAITDVFKFFQGRRMEQDIGRIEVTTRGILNQLIALQETANKWWPWMAEATGVLWKIHAVLVQLGITGSGASKRTEEEMQKLAEQAQKATDSVREITTAASRAVPVVENLSSAHSALEDVATNATSSVEELAETTKTSSGAIGVAFSRLADAAEKAVSTVTSAVSMATSGAARAIFAVGPASTPERPVAPGGITIRFEGGTTRDREFAQYVIDQFVRQAKATGQLV